jgi:hypothetical protein
MQLSEEGEEVFIAGIQGIRKYGGSAWRLAMCDLARHYFNIGKIGSAVLLVSQGVISRNYDDSSMMV